MADNNYTRRGDYKKKQPDTDALGKLPPRDIELENVVIGALMLDQDAYMNVSDILVPESFYDPVNRKIYEAISQLGFNQQPIDMLTVTDKLRQLGTLEEVGGAHHIAELTSKVFSSANITFHARIIAQKYLARRLISFASQLETEAFDESNDVDDLMQRAEGSLFEISQTQLKREVTQIDPVLTQAMEQIQAAANSKTGLSGLQTGYHDLDKLTGGWQPADLIIVAARPAMGKTALVLSMAKNMAMDYNIPVGIFTLEMPNVQLAKRMMSNLANLPGEKIKSGQLNDEEWDRLNESLRTAYSSPLYLDETPGLSITELRTKARRLVREKGVKIIIIDYLQLMNATGMKLGSREQEVSTISRSLKALAKELSIPIIALSQLNRSTENREDKRPQLSDLRESGAIEQDADIVCFIHRPEYYTKSTEDGRGNDIRGLAELIVAKHRNGAVDDVKLRFVSRYARFENWDESYNVVQQSLKNAPGERLRSKMGNDTSPIPTDFSSLGSSGQGNDLPMPDIMPDLGEAEMPF
ncbi:MAG: replicative DNA helicase [Clostridium sp.]|nr:replicative DNA helicase [Prevotella sp.]MCM1428305.1 replicative DNA helicase [Clostridium sp.]MCM1474777.1 replicative DNA helicase [Muribaculaceae bacterium]